MATQRNPQPVFDRVPPQNLDAERSVLGAMLLNPDAIGTAIEILRDKPYETFYAEAHQHIYSGILELYRTNTPVDAVTLKEQLVRDGTLDPSGGLAYVAELSGAVPTSANIEHYAKIVLDTSILRRLIASCTFISGEAYEVPPDVDALLDRAEAEVFSIAEKRQLNPIWKVSELLEESINRIETLIKSKSGITGIASGFRKLDDLTSGFQDSDMIVLAARPSVGKTAFALNIASHAAIENNKSVLLFSLEMAKEQLVQRLLCMQGQINSSRLRTGFLAQSEFPKLTRAADRLSRVPLFIDDTPNITVLELRSKARRHAAQHGLDMIIVDYLQLMSSAGRSENRQVEISEISRSIKGLARELRVPVIALSQLSREAERDDTGMPKLSHLRESGAIEQDADVVMMLSRPPAHDQESSPDMLILNIAKQRNGPTGKIELLFDRNIQRFKNLVEGGRVESQGSSPEQGPPPPPDIEERYEEYEDDTPF